MCLKDNGHQWFDIVFTTHDTCWPELPKIWFDGIAFSGKSSCRNICLPLHACVAPTGGCRKLIFWDWISRDQSHMCPLSCGDWTFNELPDLLIDLNEDQIRSSACCRLLRHVYAKTPIIPHVLVCSPYFCKATDYSAALIRCRQNRTTSFEADSTTFRRRERSSDVTSLSTVSQRCCWVRHGSWTTSVWPVAAPATWTRGLQSSKTGLINQPKLTTSLVAYLTTKNITVEHVRSKILRRWRNWILYL